MLTCTESKNSREKNRSNGVINLHSAKESDGTRSRLFQPGFLILQYCNYCNYCN